MAYTCIYTLKFLNKNKILSGGRDNFDRGREVGAKGREVGAEGEGSGHKGGRKWGSGTPLSAPSLLLLNLEAYSCPCLTADQGVTSSTPAPYFRGDWSWNNFYDHSPPFPWFKKGCSQLLWPSINKLFTEGNTKMYCCGFILSLFHSGTDGYSQ